MKNEIALKNNPGSLSAAALEQRRAYYREWRKKNRDRVSANNRRYWEKKAAEAVRGAAGE